MGQSLWNCEDGVWGRVVGILKWMIGDNWWNCEGDVWGRVGGIVKVICGA